MIRPGIRALFRLALRRRDVEARETEEEIGLHISLRIEQLMLKGLSLEAARAEAGRRFGSAAALRDMRRRANQKERTMRFREAVAGLVYDVRYAARGLGGEPMFVIFIVLTMALGIGANAAMFGVLDRLLLRGPEHVVAPRQLARVTTRISSPQWGDAVWGSSPYATYLAMKNKVASFDGAAAYTPGRVLVGKGVTAEPLPAIWATADFFSLLGVRPALGRFFTAAEDLPTGPESVVVLGYGTWQRAFGSDRTVLGRTVTLDDKSFRVVGVAPRGFTGIALERVDYWIPMSLRGAQMTEGWTTKWNTSWLTAIARLKPGVTLMQASVAATQAYHESYDGTNDSFRKAKLEIVPASYGQNGKEPPEAAILRWLVGVVLAVLLIACSNVSNLLLARNVRRRGELAVRLALGAGRARLIRLLLTEGMILALAGGVAGVVVAYLTGSMVRRLLAPTVEWPSSVVGGTVLWASLGIALATGVLIGLLPALQTSRPDLTKELRATGRGGKGTRSRVRALLTISQAALSTMLLIGAALFLRSLQRLYAVNLGLEPDRVLSIDVQWPQASGGKDSDWRVELAKATEYHQRAIVAVRALPGVAHAALAVGSPLGSSVSVDLKVPGVDSLPVLPGGGPYVSSVSSDYFATVGTPLLRGRAFGAADGAGTPPVVIVSETMARLYWPGKDALGQCLMIGDDKPVPCYSVVGIAGDVHRSGFKEKASMSYYVPIGQERGFGGSGLLVRPTGALMAQVPALRAILLGLDPSIAYINVSTLQEALDPQARPWRLGATMFVLCGALALCVAAIGLYSVMSYLVASRTHELGIRAALGASGSSIVRLVVRGGAAMAVAGAALGITLAIVAGQWLQPVLFETSARDPLVLGGVGVLLLVVAILACLAPALRARRVTPMTALRSD